MRKSDRESLSAMALVGELGFGVAIPFVVCTGLGWWLDDQWGTKPWLVMTGLLIGILSTIGTFYRLATAFPAGRTPKKIREPLPLTPEPADLADDLEEIPGAAAGERFDKEQPTDDSTKTQFRG